MDITYIYSHFVTLKYVSPILPLPSNSTTAYICKCATQSKQAFCNPKQEFPCTCNFAHFRSSAMQLIC